MSPKTSKQFSKIRKEKRELIMHASLELFAENGFHATSISQIAKKAGISKGLTYNYFDSKKDILDELITHGFKSIFQNFDITNNGILSKEEFIEFIKQNFKLLSDNLKHWKLFYSLMLQPQIADTFSKDYNEVIAPMFQLLSNFIKAQGSKDPKGDMVAISAMLEGAFLYCVVTPDIFPMEVMEEKIINASFKIING